MQTLAIRLFGRLEISFEGTPWRFSAPPRVTPLLAYLLLHAGEPVGRVALATLLWPDEPEDVARTNLRRHLHEVTRALPHVPNRQWISASMESVSWPLRDDVWIDVREFERRAADRATAGEAIDLYRGDLLADFYDEWLLAEQERLRARFQDLLYDAALAARAAREFAAAVRHVDRILAQDEWREDAVRLSMAVKYEAGDRTGALSDFTKLAARLRSELRTDPMAETIALRDAIVANAPLTPLHVEEEHLDATGAPFVGRAGELDTLSGAWSRATRGGGSTFFVGGDAGIGKSRLVGELAARVRREGGRVLMGGTSNAEAFPYEPIVEALRRNIPLLMESRIDRGTLARLVPLLPELGAAVAEVAPVNDADPAAARTYLFEAVARTIEQLARTRPLLLAFEDLHWSQASTIGALEAIARRIGTAPVLLVATYRNEETGPAHPLRALVDRLCAERRAESLMLRAFSESEIEELVRATVRGDADARAVGTAVYELSDGNGLFAVQLLQGYAETGALPTQQSSPGTLAGAVAARLQTLDDRSRALAETGAIVGRSFTIEVAARALGWDEDAALDALGPLLERSLVRGAGSESFAYTFTHALIADAVYASTPESRRTARHRRIAHVISELGELGPADLAAVARHWRAAGEHQRAATAYERAAARATEVYAYDEALDSCALAIELSDDDAAVARVRLLREGINALRASREDQLRDLDAVDALARHLGDEAMAWEVLRRRIAIARVTADYEAEEAMLAELERRAVAADKLEWIAEANLLLAARGFGTNDTIAARTYAQQALEAFVKLDNAAKEVEALLMLVRVEADLGDIPQAEAYIERARARMGGRGGFELLNALLAASYASNHQQDFEGTERFATLALEAARQIGNREKEGDCLNLIGLTRTRFGDFGAARRLLDEARAIFETIGKRFGSGAIDINTGLLELKMGQIELAYEYMSKALVTMRALDQVSGQLISSTNLSSICIRLGRVDEGLALAENALVLARETGYVAFEAVARGSTGMALLLQGNAAAAIPHFEASLARQQSVGRRIDSIEMIANLALALAANGDEIAARRRVGELVAQSALFADAVWPQQMYWAAAQVYHALGDETAASTQLQLAVDALAKLTATIARNGDSGPFERLPLNAAIARTHREGVWPRVGSV